MTTPLVFRQPRAHGHHDAIGVSGIEAGQLGHEVGQRRDGLLHRIKADYLHRDRLRPRLEEDVGQIRTRQIRGGGVRVSTPPSAGDAIGGTVGPKLIEAAGQTTEQSKAVGIRVRPPNLRGQRVRRVVEKQDAERNVLQLQARGNVTDLRIDVEAWSAQQRSELVSAMNRLGARKRHCRLEERISRPVNAQAIGSHGDPWELDEPHRCRVVGVFGNAVGRFQVQRDSGPSTGAPEMASVIHP